MSQPIKVVVDVVVELVVVVVFLVVVDPRNLSLKSTSWGIAAPSSGQL